MNENIFKYKDLLNQESSLSVLDECVHLYYAVAGYLFNLPEDEVDGNLPNWSSPNKNALVNSYYIPESNKISTSTQLSVSPPTIPEQVNFELGNVAKQARVYQVTSLFFQGDETIQERVGAEENYSFVHDILLLTFHHAYFSLLPSLETDDAKFRERLLHSFYSLSYLTPNITDQFSVRAYFFIAMSDHKQASELFRASLNSIHVDEHDYITRLQVLWMHLMDMRLYREALSLLVDQFGRVQVKDMREMEELIMQTYDESKEYHQQLQKKS